MSCYTPSISTSLPSWPKTWRCPIVRRMYAALADKCCISPSVYQLMLHRELQHTVNNQIIQRYSCPLLWIDNCLRSIFTCCYIYLHINLHHNIILSQNLSSLMGYILRVAQQPTPWNGNCLSNHPKIRKCFIRDHILWPHLDEDFIHQPLSVIAQELLFSIQSVSPQFSLRQNILIFCNFTKYRHFQPDIRPDLFPPVLLIWLQIIHRSCNGMPIALSNAVLLHLLHNI